MHLESLSIPQLLLITHRSFQTPEKEVGLFPPANRSEIITPGMWPPLKCLTVEIQVTFKYEPAAGQSVFKRSEESLAVRR